MDNAACPCLAGYYCADDGVCKNTADVLAPLLGSTYILETTADQWVEPSGFAEAFDAADDFEDVYPVFAFEILQVDPHAMTLSVLLGIIHGDGLQDKGLVTYEMTGTLEIVDENRISFRLDPVDVQTILFGPVTDEGTQDTNLAWYYGLALSGTFMERGARVDDGALVAVMNPDEYIELFYLTDFEDGEDFCSQMSTYTDIECEACPNPPHDPLCLTFSAEHLSYPAVPALTLVPISTFDAKYN